MAFDPSKPFEIEGGSEGGTATMEFDPSKPFEVETTLPVSEEEQGKRNLQAVNRGEAAPFTSVDDRLKRTGKYYESSALKRAGQSVGNAIFGNEVRPEYVDAEREMKLAGTDISINDIRNSGGLGVPLANAFHAIRGIGDQAVGGIVNVGTQTAQAAREDIAEGQKAAKLDPTFLDRNLPQGINDALSVVTGDTPRRLVAATGAGAVIGANNAIRPLATAGLRVLDATAGDILRAGDAVGFKDFKQLAARKEAELDQSIDNYERKYEQPAVQALTDVGGLPAVTNTTAQIPPLLLPVKLGVEAVPAANAVGRAVEAGVNKIAPIVTEGARQIPGRIAQGVGIAGEAAADNSRLLSAGLGLHSLMHGNFAGAAAEGILGPVVGQGVRAASTRLKGIGDRAIMGPRPAPLYSAEAIAQDARIAGQVAGQATAATIPAAIGGTIGGLTAQPGDAEEGIRGGAAFATLLGTVPSMIGAGFARQAGERAVRTKQFQAEGKALLDDPFYKDNADVTASRSPEEQDLINGARGLFAGKTDNGKPVRVLVQPPDAFMEGAREANKGELPENAAPPGYYNHDTGTAHINSSAVKLGLNAVLSHEVTHSLFANGLPGNGALATVKPGLTAQLSRVAKEAAINSDGSIKPNFQKFIDDYNGSPVDWNSLPDNARDGLSKSYFYRELGAQTGAVIDAVRNPGKYALKPEASDVVFDALGDFARRRGYGNPDVRVRRGEAIPADAGLYAATREGYRALAQAPREVRPVAPGQPIAPVESPFRPATQTVSNAAQTQDQAGGILKTDIASVQSPRNSEAYQGALDVLTQPIKQGGLFGFNPADILPKLDAAIADPSTPNTVGDLISHVRTGRPRVDRTSTNPQGQTGLNSQSSSDAPLPQPQEVGGTPENATAIVAQPPVVEQIASVPVVPTPREQEPLQPTQSLGEQGNQSSVTQVQQSSSGEIRPAVASGDTSAQTQNLSQFETNTTPPQNTVVSSSSVSTPPANLSTSGNPLPENSIGSTVRRVEPEVSQSSAGPVLNTNPEPGLAANSQPVDSVVVSTNPPAGQTQASAQLLAPTGRAVVEAAASPEIQRPLSQARPEPSQVPSPTTSKTSQSSSVQTSVADEVAQGQSRINQRTTNSTPISSSLTVEDLARIREEAKAAHVPNPYPRSKPESRAAKQAADLADAQRLAVLRAHAAQVNDPRAVQLRVDPDTGKETFKGSYLSESDPVHAEILSKLDDDTRAHLSAIEEAIADKKPVNFDYISADTKGTGVTGKGRRKAQSESSAQSRAEGEGAAEEANKLFYPHSMSVTADGNVIAHGFSPDKLIQNAERVLQYNNDKGNNTLPYRTVNDPQFVRDYANYAENHNNGYKGNGEPLVGTDAIPITQTAGYEPHIIPQDRADFLNLVTQGGGDQLANTPRGQSIREFAKANGLSVDEASREVSALRAQMNAAGDFQAVTPEKIVTGTKSVLNEPLFENIRPDLITRVYQEGEGVPSSNLRAGSFAGDRRALTAKGNPSSKVAGAGFLPSREGQPITDNPTPYGYNPLRSAILPRGGTGFLPSRSFEDQRINQSLYAGREALGFGNAERENRVFSGKLDGKQRFEIGDESAKFKPDAFPINPAGYKTSKGTAQGQTLGQTLDHPELYKNYPGIEKLSVSVQYGPRYGTSGNYYPSPAPGRAQLEAFGPNKNEAMSALLHELQHNLQIKEGFTRGVNGNRVSPTEYASSAGEVEARDVQARRKLTDSQRESTARASFLPASTPEETARKFSTAKAFGDSLPSSSETVVMNNVTDKPYKGTFAPGKLYIDKYGENPYLYQTSYVDPTTLRNNLNLEGKTYAEVVNMPTTQRYIEWYRDGHEPPPIDVVLQGDDKIPNSTNRRRVVAALEAGVKRIPAVVEIGQRDDIWQAAKAK